MRVNVRNPHSFFAWLDEHQFRYAVLWGYEAAGGHARRDRKAALTLLVEDRAAAPAAQYGRRASNLLGRTCNVYSAGAGQGADFAGKAFFPEPLARAILQSRVRRHDAVAVPCDRDLYDALLYHVAYHLAEESGADALDPAALRNSAWHALLKPPAERLGRPCDLSLLDMHRLLAEQGYGIDQDRLAAYLQEQFKRLFKSRFYALFMAMELPGELNLFVLRATVVRHGFRQVLLDETAKHYQVLAVQDIPWLTRLRKARYMRGNKWRWGGWPVVAVVVFDPDPVWRPRAEREAQHSLVFNSRQFFKRELRERIVSQGGLYRKHNAMHSTDNEAEAIGHLNLFFSPEEERSLYARAEALRVGLRRRGGIVTFDPAR